MTPALSFVVVTDTAATIRQMLAALRCQTIREKIELVIICPEENGLGLGAEDVEGIGVVQVVPVGEIVPLHLASAAGVLAARAPVVVIGETHAFPEPDALELALRCFDDETVGAVSPGLRNANPGPASWGSLMVTYGAALGDKARETETISTHNAAVRRASLAMLGDELPFRLTLGGGLGEALRGRGYRLLYAPEVVFAHVNVVRLRSCFLDRFHSSRCYATGRARGWSTGRRGLHVVGAPLVPGLLGWRISHSPGWEQHRSEFGLGVWPSIVVSVVGMAVGEVAAYTSGVGRSFELIADYEVHRERHL